MGVTYQYGDGVSENHEQAAIWFHKAAERENATAQGNLCVMYRDGSGVPQRDTEAVAWYRKAAEQGYSLGQKSIAAQYYSGNQPTGSELDSLSRLMEARGIPTVVASLWNVNDRNTARLMKRFYELMISNKGMNKAKALQQLQKEEIAHGDLRSHPYYRAPFVMMGNWI